MPAIQSGGGSGGTRTVTVTLPAPAFGPPASLTATPTTGGNVLTVTAVPTAKYVFFRCWSVDRDDPQNAGNPFRWERLNAEPQSSVTFTDIYARELESYDYRCFAVDPLGAFSATPATATCTSNKWAPQNHISHWSEDLTQGGFLGWYFSGPGGNGSATGTAGNQTLTFPAASCHISQYVACYTLNTRTYTYYYRVQGTAGQTIQFHANDDEMSSGYDYVHTLTGGVDDVVFTRTFTTTGRRMRVGINTYGSSTARSVNFKRMRVAAGNIDSATMIAGYEKTSGPGTTWCEPLQINTQHTGGSTVTVSSWHRSTDPLCLQTIRIQVTTLVNIVNARLISRGNFITGSVANVKFTATNCRYYGLNPKSQGKFFGRVCDGFFDLVNVDQCYAERTSGLKLAAFTGRTDGAIKLTRTKFVDLDGRYVNADGSYIRSSYGSASGAPGGTVLGWEAVQMIYIYNLSDPAQPTVYNLPYEVPGVEIAYNEVTNRPGFNRHEDLINLAGMVGTAASPVRIHHNRLWMGGPWDMAWHQTNSGTYNYGQIIGDVSGGTGGPGGGYSGTAILLSDLFSFDTTYLFKNNSYIECFSNLLIGVSAIASIQAGRNQSIRNNTIISSGQMVSGLANATTNRRAGIQITHYADDSGASARAFNDPASIVTFAKDGTAASAGATTVTVTALPSALSTGDLIQFSNASPSSWALLTAPAASGATSLSITALSKAVTANTACRGGPSQVVWQNVEQADNQLIVSGSSTASWGETTRQFASYADATGVTPEEEWAYLGRWQRDAARAGMSAGAT